MCHGRSLYSMINSGFHGPLHSVFEHLTYKDPRDWKRDWEREEKGREVGPIWAYLNKCQQSLWAPVGITWISSGSSFWWKLPWRWQEVLMRLPRIRNTMSLPKCCRGPHALASLPLCFLAQETESFQQSPGADSDFWCSLPVWKTNTETCLFFCTPATTVLFSRQCAYSDWLGEELLQGGSHSIFHCTTSLNKTPTLPIAYIPQ